MRVPRVSARVALPVALMILTTPAPGVGPEAFELTQRAPWADRATGQPRPEKPAVLVDAGDPEAVLRIARRFGDAVLETDTIGDPMISGVMGRHRYTVFFYGCTSGRDCTTLMFRAIFVSDAHSMAEMAEWNRAQRFGTAHLDEEGDPTLEMDVNLYGGVTEVNLEDSFDLWRAVLFRFAESVGY